MRALAADLYPQETSLQRPIALLVASPVSQAATVTAPWTALLADILWGRVDLVVRPIGGGELPIAMLRAVDIGRRYAVLFGLDSVAVGHDSIAIVALHVANADPRPSEYSVSEKAVQIVRDSAGWRVARSKWTSHATGTHDVWIRELRRLGFIGPRRGDPKAVPRDSLRPSRTLPER